MNILLSIYIGKITLIVLMKLLNPIAKRRRVGFPVIIFFSKIIFSCQLDAIGLRLPKVFFFK